MTKNKLGIMAGLTGLFAPVLAFAASATTSLANAIDTAGTGFWDMVAIFFDKFFYVILAIAIIIGVIGLVVYGVKAIFGHR